MTKDQKESLKSLINHPGWKVVEEIEEQARKELWESILSMDLTNELERSKIRDLQIDSKARRDFIQNIKNNTMETYIPWI